MTDYTELKRLAEAATPGPWILGRLESYNMDGVPCRFFYRGPNDNAHTRTRVLSGTGDNGQQFDCDSDASYIAAASPDVVLSMIAEIDRLRLHIKHIGNDALRTQNQALREALKRIVFTVPALDGAGGLFFEHHGFDGEYLGVEQIDPMWVIQEMAGVAQSALAQAEGGV